jgi:hypothetical protein
MQKMQSKTAMKYFVLAGLLFFHIKYGLIPAWQSVESDFPNYYVASRLLLEGEDVNRFYDDDWFNKQMQRFGIEMQGKFSPFPPATAFIMLPLAPFSPLTAKRLWTAINLLFVGLNVSLLGRILQLGNVRRKVETLEGINTLLHSHAERGNEIFRNPPLRGAKGGVTDVESSQNDRKTTNPKSWKFTQNILKQYPASLLLLLASGFALANNLRLGQFYLILSAMILLSYLLWQQNRPVPAGILLGAGASLKYFPLVFIAAFAIRKQWKVVLAAFAAMAAIFVSELAVFGIDLYREFLAKSFVPHTDGVLSLQGGYPVAFQSVNSLLRHIFVYDAAANPVPLIDFRAGYIGGKFLTILVVFGTVTWLAFRLRKWPAEEAMPLLLALFALAAFVLLPATATYHFLLLLFPVVLLMRRYHFEKNQYARLALLCCYVMIGFLPVHFFYKFGGKGAAIFLAFPRLWLVLAMFGLGVWIVKREFAR